MRWLLAIVLASFATIAGAGTIQYQFPYAGFDGTSYRYSVQIRVFGGDTSGLAGFSFNLLYGNNSSLINFTHVPWETLDSNLNYRGFGNLTQGTIGIGQNAYRSIGATQFNHTDNLPIFGIGMAPQFVAAFTHPDLPVAIFPNLQFGVPTILGTLSAPFPLFLNFNNVQVGGTLFTSAQDRRMLLPPQSTTAIFSIPIPEPSTLVLGGLAVFGAITIARRRRFTRRSL